MTTDIKLTTRGIFGRSSEEIETISLIPAVCGDPGICDIRETKTIPFSLGNNRAYAMVLLPSTEDLHVVVNKNLVAGYLDSPFTSGGTELFVTSSFPSGATAADYNKVLINNQKYNVASIDDGVSPFKITLSNPLDLDLVAGEEITLLFDILAVTTADLEEYTPATGLLNGSISAVSTTFAGDNLTETFPSAGVIKVDDEFILYEDSTGGGSSINATDLQRGWNTSTPAAHSDNTEITLVPNYLVIPLSGDYAVDISGTRTHAIEVKYKRNIDKDECFVTQYFFIVSNEEADESPAELAGVVKSCFICTESNNITLEIKSSIGSSFEIYKLDSDNNWGLLSPTQTYDINLANLERPFIFRGIIDSSYDVYLTKFETNNAIITGSVNETIEVDTNRITKDKYQLGVNATNNTFEAEVTAYLGAAVEMLPKDAGIDIVTTVQTTDLFPDEFAAWIPNRGYCYAEKLGPNSLKLTNTPSTPAAVPVRILDTPRIIASNISNGERIFYRQPLVPGVSAIDQSIEVTNRFSQIQETPSLHFPFHVIPKFTNSEGYTFFFVEALSLGNPFDVHFATGYNQATRTLQLDLSNSDDREGFGPTGMFVQAPGNELGIIQPIDFYRFQGDSGDLGAIHLRGVSTNPGPPQVFTTIRLFNANYEYTDVLAQLEVGALGTTKMEIHSNKVLGVTPGIQLERTPVLHLHYRVVDEFGAPSTLDPSVLTTMDFATFLPLQTQPISTTVPLDADGELDLRRSDQVDIVPTVPKFFAVQDECAVPIQTSDTVWTDIDAPTDPKQDLAGFSTIRALPTSGQNVLIKTGFNIDRPEDKRIFIYEGEIE